MSNIEAVHVHIASADVPLGQAPPASPELVEELSSLSDVVVIGIGD